MSSTSRRAACLAAAVVSALGAQAAEAAQPKFKHAQFKVKLTATQTTEWSTDRTWYDGCVSGDVRTTGSGTERLTFKGEPSNALHILKMGKTVALIARHGSRLNLAVSGSYTRNGKTDHTQLSGGEPQCGGSEPGVEPTPPDCGTKVWAGKVDLDRVEPRNYPAGDDLVVPLVPVFLLDRLDLGKITLQDLFANCPGGGGDDLIPTINSAFSEKKLLGKAKKVVVTGSDTSEYAQDGFRSKKTFKWRMELTRVAKAKLPKNIKP